MTLEALLKLFEVAPIVASAQASEGSPLADPETLLKLAQSSLQAGSKVLRLQGVEAINRIHQETKAPTIALIKRHYDDSPVYITPTMKEVEELLSTDAEAIGLDATLRPRPGGASLEELLKKVKAAGRLAMADCDTFESALNAQRLGFDLIGTTLAGYTQDRPMTKGPDLHFLRQLTLELKTPIIAEGRYSENWQVRAALRMGAKAVVMGAALNDTPVLTARYLKAAKTEEGPVAAFDIGGTWLRFGLFSSDWELLESERIPLPHGADDRLSWMKERAASSGAKRIGVSSGGVVHPKEGIVMKAKPIIPGHLYTAFHEQTLGLPTVALNDGLATAWGHACHPLYAGKRVATLALGTGVGFGLVDRGRILMGLLGDPPHLNDQLFKEGGTIEEALGGASFSPPSAAPSSSDLGAVEGDDEEGVGGGETYTPKKGSAEEAAQTGPGSGDEDVARTGPGSGDEDVARTGPGSGDEDVARTGPGSGRGLSGISKARALAAALQCKEVIEQLYHPDDIVVCGGVGLSDWLDLGLPKSPFGADAGLYGAAALALWPPES